MLRIYCRNISIQHREHWQSKGPWLFAMNHPNSFLDAIILCAHCEHDLYSLARGDAFKNPRIARLLRYFRMLPVYREREGAAHLSRNYHTFDACVELFRQGKSVLIFSEALCENEWHLRPLKKGTARLALQAWQQQIPVQILPIGINYSSFHLPGKSVHVQVGEPILPPTNIPSTEKNGECLNNITGQIERQLRQRVYEIKPDDEQAFHQTFPDSINRFQKRLLTVPALLGALLHAPFYLPLKYYISKKARYSGHYDSIMVAVMLLSYPLYCGIAVVATGNAFGLHPALFLLLFLPLLATAYCRWMPLSSPADKKKATR